MTQDETMAWEPETEVRFRALIARIPLFHREIARQVVEKRAVVNARERGASRVAEEDVLRAFFSEVPEAFYGLMIRLFEEVGWDYRPYET